MVFLTRRSSRLVGLWAIDAAEFHANSSLWSGPVMLSKPLQRAWIADSTVKKVASLGRHARQGTSQYAIAAAVKNVTGPSGRREAYLATDRC